MTVLIANAFSEPWRISVAPPPGLVSSTLSVAATVSADEKHPKEVLQRRQGPVSLTNTTSAGGGSRTSSSSDPELACTSQRDRLLKCSKDSVVGDSNACGVWAQAVLDVAPHLDAEQLHRALRILDQAIINSQHAKALEQIKLQELQFGGNAGFFPSFPGIPVIGSSTEYLKMQVQEQQRLLFAELQQLRNLARSMSARAAKSATKGSSLQEKQNSKASQQFQAQALKHTTSDDGKAQKQQSSNKHPPERQRKQQEARPGARQAQTLSTSLQMLSNEDPACLFIVRRINKLGFKAARKLKQHFSSYGSVVRVLVAHSTVRQHGDPESHTRRRPSSLGFVHMAIPDAVIKVLAVGVEHVVNGSLIRVQRFERQQSEAAAIEAAEAEGAEEEQDKLDEEDEVTEEDLAPKATGKQAAGKTFHHRKNDNNQASSWARQKSVTSGSSSTASGSNITSTESDMKPDSE